jgi:hypothetical protein
VKNILIPFTVLSGLLLPLLVDGQTNYKFENGTVTVLYNDPQNLPKNEFALSFINVGNLFGCRVYENFRLDETQNIWARVTLPYGKGAQGGDVSTSLEDEVKIGYNVRIGYERSLLGGEAEKYKTTYLKSQGNTVTYTKDIPTVIRRQLIASGGFEMNRLGNQINYFPDGNPDIEDIAIYGLNPSFAGIFLGVGYRSDFSMGLYSDDFGGEAFKRGKMRSFRASVDLVVAFSQNLSNYIVEFDSNEIGGIGGVQEIDADDERLPELSQKNLGFRVSLDRTASQFGWKRMIVVYGFDYTMIPTIDGGPTEMVNVHAGIGFMSKKFVKQSLMD